MQSVGDKRPSNGFVFYGGILLAGLLAAGMAAAGEPAKIRIGQFPNVTHAQALMARATGAFDAALGIPVEWTTFNAGPSAIEALFAGAIDATYIGPNPAVNGYLKSGGASLRIVAGSAGGGAALVLRPEAGIRSEQDFADKIIATPQLGNTQDVAARAWFLKHGYKPKEKGGTITILPLANPDQLLMFQKQEIDGAWTIEPWVSRLELEAGGQIFLEEKDLWPGGHYVTTVLVVSRDFLTRYPEMVRKLVAAHAEITDRLNADKAAAIPVINGEIKKETGKALPAAVIERAMSRVEFTCDPMREALIKSAQDAYALGFLKENPQFDDLFDLNALEAIKR